MLATLIRLLGDFELAEEALHDAFIAAVEQWPRDGIPRNPRAWLVSAGRFKAIDNLRRRARFDASQRLLAEQLEEQAEAPAEEGDAVEDDRLRLIFTCCHPALTPEAQVALTLREVCDLRTEEIARAFLAAPSAIAQRIVRAKNKIREARIPYQVPTLEELPERLGNVLQVIYLVFNEGYSASTGASLTRADLSGEAIRVGRLLVELLPDPEALGLLALMLLHDSRRQARISASGELVRLDEQDRALWDRGLIVEGLGLVERALASRRVGPYTLQAAIVAVHAQAPRAEDTDWARIVAPTTRCCTWRRRRWSNSTAPWPWPCAMASKSGWPWSMRCWREVNWPITTWRTRRVPTSAAVSVAAARPARPTARRWPWRARSRSGASSAAPARTRLKPAQAPLAQAVRASPPTPRVNHQNARPPG